MLRRLLYMVLFLPLSAIGQYHISGRVIDMADKKPLPNASILLANTTVGAKSNDDGTFTLANIRSGKYELVVSIVGYVAYRQSIMVNTDLQLPDIEMVSQAIALREVRITPDPKWALHYDMFRREFIGDSEYAAQCKILNPKTIDFHYDEARKELTANSSDFIEIENKALGYKVRYMLSNFTKNYRTSFLYFEGSAFFEPLNGKKSAEKKWQKNRQNAYLGSSMHFLRSVIAGHVAEEGFKAERLIRKPNPDYKGSLDNKYIQTLVTTPLLINEYASLTDQKGEYALGFKDCLYIMYNKKPKNKGDTELIPQYITSTLTFSEPYAFFDNNGIVINPQSILFEGNWAKNRIAELLPVDYVPEP